eukprot:m.382211 g.382211  ORF g.382211 m.382211 type:complete len:517 (+) comp56246_c1_seq15:110-1660(+)
MHTMSSESSVTRFAGPDGKLTFDDWSFLMEVKFARNGWLFAIDRSRQAAPKVCYATTAMTEMGSVVLMVEDAESQLAAASAAIYSELVNATSGAAFELVRNTRVGDGITAWMVLKKAYVLSPAQRAARAALLQSELLAIRWREGADTVDSFSYSYLRRLRELRECGEEHVLPSTLIKVKILQGLPNRLNGFREFEAVRPFDDFRNLFDRLALAEMWSTLLDGKARDDAVFFLGEKRCRPRFSGNCHSCGLQGHKRSACRRKQQLSDDAQKIHSASELDQCKVSNRWCLDSGSTCHVATDRSVFETFEPTTEETLGTFGPKSLAVLGRGTVVLRVRDEGGNSLHIRLLNVRFVPDGQANLISLDRLVHNERRIATGHSFCASSRGTFIRLASGISIPLRIAGSLRWLDAVAELPRAQTPQQAFMVAEDAPIPEVHPAEVQEPQMMNARGTESKIRRANKVLDLHCKLPQREPLRSQASNTSDSFELSTRLAVRGRKARFRRDSASKSMFFFFDCSNR